MSVQRGCSHSALMLDLGAGPREEAPAASEHLPVAPESACSLHKEPLQAWGLLPSFTTQGRAGAGLSGRALA